MTPEIVEQQKIVDEMYGVVNNEWEKVCMPTMDSSEEWIEDREQRNPRSFEILRKGNDLMLTVNTYSSRRIRPCECAMCNNLEQLLVFDKVDDWKTHSIQSEVERLKGQLTYHDFTAILALFYSGTIRMLPTWLFKLASNLKRTGMKIQQKSPVRNIIVFF